MATLSQFSADEVDWLEKIDASEGVRPPDAVAARLVSLGVVDRTALGLRTTGMGRLILRDAGRRSR